VLHPVILNEVIVLYLPVIYYLLCGGGIGRR
jgi:hypothetical protein